ncbi:putative coiled-coil domain-containing protein [Apostichopus japonicus]|uniref:Putative coiled-coil domain-containing protein n=1 Tax=Stichopus japonicus TaxID=307972 RepID=A0A2G8JQV2_STIJA|nr:putative coiled-coil domain-containing protein [Apostichopus japonicus]
MLQELNMVQVVFFQKQFSYKSRSQSYPVRKAQTNVDSKDVSKQQQQRAKTGSQKGSSTIKQHRVPHSGERERSGSTENKGNSKTQKKQVVDFVKKNKTVGGTSGGTGKRSSEVRTTNTITLTQEQLNAILQSIGTASGGNGAPAIAIENGEVKVESPDVKTNGTVGQEKDEKRKMDDDSNKNKESKTMDEDNEKKESSKKETDDEDKKTVASENVFHLLKQLEEDMEVQIIIL